MINTIVMCAYSAFVVFFYMAQIVCEKEELLQKAEEELKVAKQMNKYYELAKGRPKS